MDDDSSSKAYEFVDVTQFNDDYFKDIENLVFDSLERFLKETWPNLAELEDSQHTKAPIIENLVFYMF